MSEATRRAVVFPTVHTVADAPAWLSRSDAPVTLVAFRVLAGAPPEEAPHTDEEVAVETDVQPEPEVEPEPVDPLAEERELLAEETRTLAEARVELETRSAELATAFADLATLRARTLQETEKEALDLAVVIARSILETELALRPELHITLAHAALARLVPADGTVLRLGSKSADIVETALGTEFKHEGVSVRVARDPSIEGYGCIVESSIGSVDASVDHRLEQVHDALDAAHHESEDAREEES